MTNNSKSRKLERKELANIRQDARIKRDDAEQLAYLRHRGHGHCAEAQILAAKSK